jgi:hypothetical protein
MALVQSTMITETMIPRPLPIPLRQLRRLRLLLKLFLVAAALPNRHLGIRLPQTALITIRDTILITTAHIQIHGAGREKSFIAEEGINMLIDVVKGTRTTDGDQSTVTLLNLTTKAAPIILIVDTENKGAIVHTTEKVIEDYERPIVDPLIILKGITPTQTSATNITVGQQGWRQLH